MIGDDQPIKPAANRYGIGELYGRDFSKLSAKEIRRLSAVKNTDQMCRFVGKPCNKPRGVCTLRQYETRGGEVLPADSPLVTVCPRRFSDNEIVSKWVGKTLLDTEAPAKVTEVDFLQGPAAEADEDGEPVGRIDNILLAPGTKPLVWCAVELQAVYFSGKGMKSQYEEFARWRGPGLPWPNEVRRPDYRSSGPKRLMPQLQTKVPTLRRWGKKMAVVTDRAFFENMGKMQEVPHISNCDIVWFVVDYFHSARGFDMAPVGEPHQITLERAIEGLIAGEPVSLAEFERRITAKLLRPPKKGRAR